jgi:hypothetical protein
MLMAATLSAACAAMTVNAQQPAQRPASPRGAAQTQVGGKWMESERGPRYEGGKWIEVDYGRPIKRGRASLFGAGADYGKALNAGAPVWRVGANQSTRFKTEVPLMLGDKTVPAGEYSMFVELKSPTEWTLILSSHAAQEKFDRNEKTALWGSYNYTPDKDVARAPMQVEQIRFSVDQLSIGFTDVTADSGMIRIWWDTTMASVAFKVAS